MESQCFEVSEGEDIRLDLFLTQRTDLSRSRVAQLIREGQVSVNTRQEDRPAFKVQPGDIVHLAVPEIKDSGIQPEKIALDFIYQDSDIAVINKPAGMVVHPAAGNDHGTVVNALLYALHDLSGIGGEVRPGIVHRLDKDTSGILIVAKNDAAHIALSEQFSKRSLEKHYRAVCFGNMKEESGFIDAPIGRSPNDRKKMAIIEGGKPAQTEWTCLQNLKQASYLDVHILTGRTHQIRVHMKSTGHPVLGDVIYAPNMKMPVHIPRLMLHAYSLSIEHPITGEPMTFTAPLPQKMQDTINKLS